MPAPVNKDQQALLYKTNAVGFAVAPIWEGIELIRDNVTSADTGQIRLTGVMYTNFKVLRPAGYQQVAFQLP